MAILLLFWAVILLLLIGAAAFSSKRTGTTDTGKQILVWEGSSTVRPGAGRRAVGALALAFRPATRLKLLLLSSKQPDKQHLSAAYFPHTHCHKANNNSSPVLEVSLSAMTQCKKISHAAPDG